MNDTITAAIAEELLLRAVAERGDQYRYPGINPETRLYGPTCHYRWDTSDLDNGLCKPEDLGQPACVAGQVFAYAGILDSLFGEYEPTESDDPEFVAPTDRFFDNNDQGIEDLVLSYAGWHLQITPLAAAMLKEAQSAQDLGCTWGTSARRGINIRHTRRDLLDEVRSDVRDFGF